MYLCKAQYEVPITELIALLVVLQGWGAKLVEVSRTLEPTRALVRYGASQGAIPDGELGDLSSQKQALFLNAMLATHGSIRSVQVYGLWMHELIEKASHGDAKSVIKAAAVDRMALMTTTGSQLLAEAELAGDRAFVRKALTSEIPKKRKTHDVLRYLARVMRDDAAPGGRTSLSSDQLIDLFCHRLNLYAYSADAAKSLRELLRRAASDSTT